MELDKGTVALFLGLLFGGAILWALMRKSGGGVTEINNPGQAPCNVGFWGVNVPCGRLDFYRDKVLGVVEEIPSWVQEKAENTASYLGNKTLTFEKSSSDFADQTNIAAIATADIPVVGTTVDVLTNPVKTKNAVIDGAYNVGHKLSLW